MLVQSAKSIANQAIQATTGALSYSNITGTGTVGADTTQATSSSTYANAASNIAASTQASFVFAGGHPPAGAANGDTFQVTLNAVTKTFTYTTAAGTAANGTFSTAAEFAAAVTDAAGGFGTGVTQSTNGNAVTVSSAARPASSPRNGSCWELLRSVRRIFRTLESK